MGDRNSCARKTKKRAEDTVNSNLLGPFHANVKKWKRRNSETTGDRGGSRGIRWDKPAGEVGTKNWDHERIGGGV